MARIFTYFVKLVKFVAMMIIMTIVCTVAWEAFLAGKVYTCTDGPTGYLTPGDWVHAHDGLPVVVVPKIVPPHDMSDPDTIKQGWSVTGLWSVWVVFLGSSVIVSVLFAWIPWVETLDWLAKRRRENVRAV